MHFARSSFRLMSLLIRRAMMNLFDFGAFPAKETPRPVQSMAAASVAACENTALGSSRNARHFITRSLQLQIGVAPPGCPEHGVSSKQALLQLQGKVHRFDSGVHLVTIVFYCHLPAT